MGTTIRLRIGAIMSKRLGSPKPAKGVLIVDLVHKKNVHY